MLEDVSDKRLLGRGAVDCDVGHIAGAVLLLAGLAVIDGRVLKLLQAAGRPARQCGYDPDGESQKRLPNGGTVKPTEGGPHADPGGKILLF